MKKIATVGKRVLVIITILTVGIVVINQAAAGEAQNKVILIGIDAADWHFIEPLLKQNKLPHLQSVLQNASYGKLKTVICKLWGVPTMQWTSLITGKIYQKHGIGACDSLPVEFNFRGHDSGLRKAKAIWNILSENNIKVGIVGWPVTWPAEKINGYMASNFVKYRATPSDNIKMTIEKKLQLTVTGTIYSDKKNKLHQTYPKNFYHEIKPIITKKEQIKDEEINLHFKNIGIKGNRQKFYDIKWNYVSNEIFSDIGCLFLNKPGLNFISVIMHGIDVAFHRNNADTQQLLNDYYIYIDRKLGEYLSLADRRTTVIIVSEHGNKGKKGHFQEAIEGIIIVKGANIKKNYDIENASILDIAPTILYLFKLDIPRDMDGKVLLDIFEDNYIKKHPITMIDSYENNRKSHFLLNKIPLHSFDDLILERLRKIGYLTN